MSKIKLEAWQELYEQDLLKDYDCLVHPLLKVHIIEDSKTPTNENGDYNWCYVFIFKYKGKVL